MMTVLGSRVRTEARALMVTTPTRATVRAASKELSVKQVNEMNDVLGHDSGL